MMQDGFLLNLALKEKSCLYELLTSQHPFEVLLSQRLIDESGQITYVGHHKPNWGVFGTSSGLLKFYNLEHMNCVNLNQRK